MPTTTMGTTRVVVPYEERLPAFVHRNRHVLGPPLLAGLAFVVAGGAHATWWWAGVILAVVCAVLGIETAVTQLPSKREKQVAIPGWVLGCGWVAVGSWAGPFHTPMAVAALVVLLPLWAAWFWHHRVRRGVDVDRRIPAWGDGSAVGLGGTHARGTRAGADWYSFKIRPDEPGRYTIKSFRSAKARIAARFGVRSEAVSFRETRSEGEIEVTIREGDRKATDTPHLEVRHIAGPHRVGAYVDGQPWTQALYLDGVGAIHGATVGVTGSGKSGLVNKLAEIIVKAPDALLILSDLKPGALELRAWRSACVAFLETPEDSERMIDALNAISVERAKRIPGRIHIPSETDPLLGWLGDESARLFAPHLLGAAAAFADRRAAQRAADVRTKKFEQEITVWRTFGIAARLYTQTGEAEAFGSTRAREQLLGGDVTAFRCGKDANANFLFPARRDFSAADIPRNAPGTAYAEGPTVTNAELARTDYLTDEDVARIVGEWAGKQPALHPKDVTAADRATDGWFSSVCRSSTRPHLSPVVSPKPKKTEPVPEAKPRMTPEESRQLVWHALAAFPDGAGPKQIAETCSKSEQLVQSRLVELEERGRAERTGRRRRPWRALTSAPPSTDRGPDNDDASTDSEPL